MVDISQKVAEQLANAAATVTDGVVAVLVEREVNKRVEAVATGVTQLDALIREGRRFDKADVKVMDADGNLTSEGYSPGLIEQRKKHGEKVAKLEKAIEKALNGDLQDLNQLVNQSGKGGGKSDQSSE